MEEFRHTIRTRITMTSALVLLGVVLITLNTIFGDRAAVWLNAPESIRDFRHSFISGFIAGLMAVAVVQIVRYASTLRNDEKLRSLHIKETDERVVLIHQKAGSTGMALSIIGVLVAALVSSFFSFTVFVTLISACLFISLIVLLMKMVYRTRI